MILKAKNGNFRNKQMSKKWNLNYDPLSIFKIMKHKATGLITKAYRIKKYKI